MKKLLMIASVAGMFAFAACSGNTEQTEDQTTAPATETSATTEEQPAAVASTDSTAAPAAEAPATEAPAEEKK